MSLTVHNGQALDTPFTVDEARHVTDLLREHLEEDYQLIIDAYQRRAWSALGYQTWDDYCTSEFGDIRLKLPREERQDVVRSLRDSGLSIRAIAAATGAGDKTVQRDLKATEPPPRVVNDYTSEDNEIVDAEIVREDPPEPREVTGTDGKTYKITPKPVEQKPKRSPLGDTARTAGWEFRKAVERLERLADDDRFAANREQVATHLRNHLLYAIETCQTLLDQLNPGETR
jgi:hypothetical protein